MCASEHNANARSRFNTLIHTSEHTYSSRRVLVTVTVAQKLDEDQPWPAWQARPPSSHPISLKSPSLSLIVYVSLGFANIPTQTSFSCVCLFPSLTHTQTLRQATPASILACHTTTYTVAMTTQTSTTSLQFSIH